MTYCCSWALNTAITFGDELASEHGDLARRPGKLWMREQPSLFAVQIRAQPVHLRENVGEAVREAPLAVEAESETMRVGASCCWGRCTLRRLKKDAPPAQLAEGRRLHRTGRKCLGSSTCQDGEHCLHRQQRALHSLHSPPYLSLSPAETKSFPRHLSLSR